MQLNVNAIMAISYRDLVKLLRDRTRLITSLMFPFLLIGVFGGTLSATQGPNASFNYLTFTFTGVFAYTLFASATAGVISLVEDRQNDFSQELFVSPISRYSIILGKIWGETLVSLPQGLAIVVFALILGVPLSAGQIFVLLPMAVVASMFGAAFGLLIMANAGNQRSATQLIPFITIPQIFLSGAFMQLQALPPYLDVLSRIAPMRYVVDLTRGVFYNGQSQYAQVVAESPLVNLFVIAALFSIFLVAGTWLFVRGERNR